MIQQGGPPLADSNCQIINDRFSVKMESSSMTLHTISGHFLRHTNVCAEQPHGKER